MALLQAILFRSVSFPPPPPPCSSITFLLAFVLTATLWSEKRSMARSCHVLTYGVHRTSQPGASWLTRMTWIGEPCAQEWEVALNWALSQ